MPLEQSWPKSLPKELAKYQLNINVVNGSISGDTTGNGLARLPSLLKQHNPEFVLIELGANDGLRGFSPNLITTNLEKMIKLSQTSGAQVIIMQIHVPPNYGKRYSQLFSQIYPKLAKQYQLPLLPFFLEEIIMKEEWIMPDGLHPTSEAQPWIAHYVASHIHPHLSHF